MGKVNRLISIEYETNEKLKKEANASGLISELLDNHFNAHKSNNVSFLNKELENQDLQLKQIQLKRDSIADRIRMITERFKDKEANKEANHRLKQKEKILTAFLSDKVKTKELTFTEYRNIKDLDNWEDCIEALMNGSLDLRELAEKSKPKELKQEEDY